MCGRYTLLRDELKVRQRFCIEHEIQNFSESYNVAPGQDVLAVIFDGKKRRAGYLRWGLVPSWAKDEKIGYKMINARSETIDEKVSFKRLLGRKHCLIVADSFYEWKKEDGQKTPMRIQVPDQELFAFLGLWDKWEHRNGSLFTCTMLTRESNAFMKPIHHRMPIILPEKAEAAWIEKDFRGITAVETIYKGIRTCFITSISCKQLCQPCQAQ